MSERQRIDPLPEAEWDDLLRRVLSGAPGGTERPVNVFTTLARHPGLFKDWIRLGGRLLAGGTIDADGCLVCPWHQSRYDVRTGEMVEGPRGFLAYHGPTPIYSQLVAAVGRLVKLRVRRAVRDGDDVVLE